MFIESVVADGPMGESLSSCGERDDDAKPESTDGRREGSGRGLGSYKRDDPVLNSGRREVCRRFWGHRRRSAVAVASEMA